MSNVFNVCEEVKFLKSATSWWRAMMGKCEQGLGSNVYFYLFRLLKEDLFNVMFDLKLFDGWLLMMASCTFRRGQPYEGGNERHFVWCFVINSKNFTDDLKGRLKYIYQKSHWVSLWLSAVLRRDSSKRAKLNFLIGNNNLEETEERHWMGSPGQQFRGWTY